MGSCRMNQNPWDCVNCVWYLGQVYNTLALSIRIAIHTILYIFMIFCLLTLRSGQETVRSARFSHSWPSAHLINWRNLLLRSILRKRYRMPQFYCWLRILRFCHFFRHSFSSSVIFLWNSICKSGFLLRSWH